MTDQKLTNLSILVQVAENVSAACVSAGLSPESSRIRRLEDGMPLAALFAHAAHVIDALLKEIPRHGPVEFINGLPPALTVGHDWDVVAGKSATVLVRELGYQQQYRPACYFHALEEWHTELNPNAAANVIEWWPMPAPGTGITPVAKPMQD